jgi:hypothetical protein
LIVRRLPPKSIELVSIQDGRFVCMGSASAGTLEWAGKVYERSGNTFVKVSDKDPIAKEHAQSKIHLARKPVFHCPGWLALDDSVNAVASHVYAVAVQQLGGLQKASAWLGLRLMNMDIAFQWVLRRMAEGHAPAQIAAEHGHFFEKMMRGDEDRTGHEALEQQAEIIRLIAGIESAYKYEVNSRSERLFRKRSSNSTRKLRGAHSTSARAILPRVL